MKATNKIRVWITTLLLLIASIVGPKLKAQEGFVSSGNSATGSGGSISYSIGQVCYAVQSGAAGTIVEGVQQPFEISGLSINDLISDTTLNCKVYPNPTSDFIILETGDGTTFDITYQLINNLGKELKCGTYRNKVQINMQACLPGMYCLRVISPKGICKSFKIVKY